MSIAKQIHLQLAIMLYLTRVSNANVNGIEGIFERMKEFFGGQSGQGSSLGGSPILSQGYPGYPSGQLSQFSGVGGMPPGLQGQLQFPGANGGSPMLPSPLLQQGSNNIPPGFPVPPTQTSGMGQTGMLGGPSLLSKLKSLLGLSNSNSFGQNGNFLSGLLGQNGAETPLKEFGNLLTRTLKKRFIHDTQSQDA